MSLTVQPGLMIAALLGAHGSAPAMAQVPPDLVVGFVRGSKRTSGSPFYDNIMLWRCANGMSGVNVEYRLAPQHKGPSGGEDLGMAVRWTADNAATHGGDRNRIFLMGHSAGATHVAIYVAHLAAAALPAQFSALAPTT